jgi:hypothetical protein
MSLRLLVFMLQSYLSRDISRSAKGHKHPHDFRHLSDHARMSKITPMATGNRKTFIAARALIVLGFREHGRALRLPVLH